MAHINPKQEAVAPNIAAMREQFSKKFEKEISSGAFDQRDVDRFLKDDIYAGCFLRTLRSKNDIPKALEVVDECFKFRKAKGVNDMKKEDFDEEITSKNGVYFRGKDKQGFKVLYIDVSANTAKNEEEKEAMRRFVAYTVETHHRETPGEMVTVIFDMHKATTLSFSKEMSTYFTTCFATYYPGFLAYMVNYEMPMLLGAIWKVVSSFLNADQKSKVLQIGKSKIKDYLPDDNLWDHMK